MKYNLVQNDDNANITVLLDGDLYGADSTHANWQRILEKVINNDESGLADLFDASVAAAKRFDRLSERVAVKDGAIFFDNEPVNNALTQQVVRFLNEGVDDFKPLVNFFEKVEQNPQNHSREQLYAWLAKHNFTITDDGDFIAYKSVYRDQNDDYEFRSTMSGHAIVDGVEQNGYTRYNLGSVLEMPRGSVQWNPSVGCSVGLHAGTWSYAKGYSGNVILKVKINPRDVVSVPTDSNEQKLRVCRLVVLEIAEEEIQSAFWTQNVGQPVEDETEYCVDCGQEWCDGECEGDDEIPAEDEVDTTPDASVQGDYRSGYDWFGGGGVGYTPAKW